MSTNNDWESYEVYFARIQANRAQRAPAPSVATGDWEPYIAPAEPAIEAQPASAQREPAQPVVLNRGPIRRNVLTTCSATVGGA